MNEYVIGLDYGTDSVRAVVADARTGEQAGTAVFEYPRWKAGKYCDPDKHQYRQHPLDYVEGMVAVVREALAQCPAGTAARVAGMAFDTTGSTPVLTDESGTPLALLPEMAENPNAMFILWKDHTAVREASQINEQAHRWEIDYTAYEGGTYSSEWVWAKALHVLREDGAVRAKARSWVEHCDWLPALITGNTRPEKILRSRCAAGHKAMWLKQWGGLPPEEFLTALDPLLKGFRAHLYEDTFTSDTKAGYLTAEWAGKLGLPVRTAVAVGAFDCHFGAVGAEITPNVLVRVIGTSTCDILVSDEAGSGDRLIRGICGQVDGSVIPGMTGLEAGQSAFGDVYAWFRRMLAWPLETLLPGLPGTDIEKALDNIIPALTVEAEKISSDHTGIVALDWLNGRRTPDADQRLTGAITGLHLGSTAPAVFRALIEATAFGSRAIVDRFVSEGVRIDAIIGIGGIAKKSPLVMQILADVLEKPIRVARSEQACAFGAAMFAATAAGLYGRVEEAQKAMGQGFEAEYHPRPAQAEKYRALYAKYLKIGAFAESLSR